MEGGDIPLFVWMEEKGSYGLIGGSYSPNKGRLKRCGRRLLEQRSSIRGGGEIG